MARTLWWMQSLGRHGMPPSLRLRETGELLHECTVKHDFWAATGFYQQASDGRRVVVKINRVAPILFFPLRWTGRWLRYREARAFRLLAEVPNVPALLGIVGPTGLVHAYVDGAPLQKTDAVPDGFFDELLDLVNELADRGVAYVDTNKPENILLGTDGRPHLIDFQISFYVRAWWPPMLARRLLEMLRRTDRYHCLKHKRRLRPDLLTPCDLEILGQRQRALKLHRKITKPYFAVRRPIMRWLHATGRVNDAGSN